MTQHELNAAAVVALTVLAACTLAYILVSGILRAMLWLLDSDLRSAWLRLRAWLRPYPDDAQMQARMLDRVAQVVRARKRTKELMAILESARGEFVRAGAYVAKWEEWHRTEYMGGTR